MPIFVSDDIVLKDNTISTAQSNADVQIVPNGSGSLSIDTVSIAGNKIKTNTSNANLELDANASGYVRVLGTGAFGVPAGTTAQRTSGVAGQLRLNTTTGNFEGYDGSSWGSLAGTTSAEADTSNTVKVTAVSIGTTITTVDSFTTSDFQTVKYNYVVFDEINTEFETGFIHLIHDGSNSYINQYGVTHTGSSSVATFSTDISGSTVRLRMTGVSTTNSITLFRTGLGDNSEADSSSTNTGLSINSDVDTAQESLDTTSASTYRAVQYFILASSTAGDGSTVGHECLKVNVTHDGSNAYHTEYGRTSTTDGHLLAIDVDINSGNIRLLGTGATANVSVKVYKIQIKDTEEAATGDNVSVIVNTDVDSAIENINTFENSITASTTFQAAHYFNSVKASAGVGGAEFQVSEVLVVGDGTNIFESEFGIVTSGNRQLITYSTDYDSTTARLRGVGATTDLVVNGYRVNMERKGGGVSAASVVLNASDQSISGLKTFTSGIATDDITSPSSNANITLDPAGTGKIDLAGNTILKDSIELQFGTDADTNIKHTGTNFNINETTGDINIRTYADNKDVIISTDDSSGGITEYIVADGSTGAVKLKHYGTTVFETTSTGASITNTSTSDALLITTTEDSNSAGPVITLKRNSSSPANADYLGQIKFQGENDADQEVLYAKISGKILDVGDGTEDGILEFAFKKNGSNNISGRFRSDSLQLLNDTSLRVTGHVELGVLSGDPSGTTNIAHIYAKDESSSAEVFVRDEAGNVTKISPHNEQGEWEYYSRNTKTGKTVRVNMEEMIRDIEQLTGKTYIQDK